ncbi:hypothetical protein AMELA_G00171900 [Ameiurus melas]|uniref:Uncharacterized protein n=1 Tax=Ameiurus melas TaxID=219545 RepID=A0A7J6AGA0_AMEME|nr:hypothetical protein AMELA_G00171900 [Ameiurus melas]
MGGIPVLESVSDTNRFDDSLELHMVLLELEDVERRIRGLLDQQAQLQERRTALESSCASVHTPKVSRILKDERIERLCSRRDERHQATAERF